MSALPAEVYEVRAEICARCPSPCERQRDVDFQATACARCPLPRPRWANYGGCRPGAPAPATMGAGDLVAKFAQPIARAIDAATGGRTNVAGCGGCKQRQAYLNSLVPDIRHPLGKGPQ